MQTRFKAVNYVATIGGMATIRNIGASTTNMNHRLNTGLRIQTLVNCPCPGINRLARVSTSLNMTSWSVLSEKHANFCAHPSHEINAAVLLLHPAGQ